MGRAASVPSKIDGSKTQYQLLLKLLLRGEKEHLAQSDSALEVPAPARGSNKPRTLQLMQLQLQQMLGGANVICSCHSLIR
nr:hypothetical protein [Tanacetum cinerariifolium]